MEVLRSSSVAAFLDLAGDFLVEREAEHNLLLGILSSYQADPAQYAEAPYLATVVHGDRVVAAAVRTPPWRLALSEVDHPGAIHILARDLSATNLPGVVGPTAAAAHFAEAWHELRGHHPRIVRHERGFQLRRVVAPRPAGGEMVRADARHRDILTQWARAFVEEALPGGPAQDFGAMADRWIRGAGRAGYLWIDDGRPVSLTGAGAVLPSGARVGPVYTPPDLRGRGYASNLVASVSQLLLDEGRAFVSLFTDLANPTSNKIYRAIGYEPVNDVDEWDFD